MTLAQELIETFCDNFVAYYTAHANHFNVTGRNFHSDHELLGDIYEDAQEQIDTIGELIRTLGQEAPETITEILATADLQERIAFSADDRLQVVLESQEHMIDTYRELQELAEEEGHEEIANYCQDRILKHAKFVWMLRSTLE